MFFWLTPNPAPATNQGEHVTPEVTANLFERLTFGWLFPVLKTGYSRALDFEDIWRLDDKRLTANISAELERHFFERCPPSQRPLHLGGPAPMAPLFSVDHNLSKIEADLCALTGDTSPSKDGASSFAWKGIPVENTKIDPLAQQRQDKQTRADKEEQFAKEMIVEIDPTLTCPGMPSIHRTYMSTSRLGPACANTRQLSASNPSRDPEKSKSKIQSSFWHRFRCSQKLANGTLVTEVGPDGVERTYDQSLAIALLWTLRTQMMWSLFYLFSSMVILTTSSLVTKQLIRYITTAHYTPELAEPIGVGIGLAFGLALMQEAQSLFNNHYIAQAMGAGWMMRATLIDQISRKSLTLSPKSRLQLSNGRLITSVSGDCSFMENAAPALVEAIVDPARLIIGFGLLIGNLGYSALVGVAVLLASSPLLGYILNTLIFSRQQQMKIVDSRVRLLTELLNGIRQVKMYAYEKYFAKRLLEIRTKELSILHVLLWKRATLIATMTLLPTMATVLTFITYGLTGHTLDAGTIFSSLHLFAIVQQPLQNLPFVFATLTDSHVALIRISKILLAGELPQHGLIVDETAEFALQVQGDFTFETSKAPDSSYGKNGCEGHDRHVEKEAKKAKMLLKRANKKRKKQGLSPLEPAKEEEDTGVPFTLNDIDLSIPRGSFVVIVGRIGNGKSALLQALIGEMRQTKGSAPIFGGKVSYMSQQPWVQNATVRDNLIFGQEPNNQRLANVIEACALTQDIEQFAGGLEAEIGERGINNSGGQKARLCLARAVYFDGDIILMDDPLAAVDSHVAQHLIEKCFCDPKILGKKTRILVSHQLSVIDHADIVIVVESGRIVQKGSPQELLAHKGGIFANLVDEYGSHKEVTQDLQEPVSQNTEEKPGARFVHPEGDEKVVVKLIQLEERNTGTVSWSVYGLYFKHLRFFSVIAVILLLLAQASQVGTTVILGFWSGQTIEHFHQGEYMGIYAGLGVAVTAFTFAGTLALYSGGLHASYSLFDSALKGVLRSPVSFHDSTPIGRIISRLSKDIETIDNWLAFRWYMVLSQVFQVFGAVVLVFYTYAYLGIIFAPMLVIYGTTSVFYGRTSRELKRINSTTCSFIYSSFQEQLTGLGSIRAYKQQDNFRRRIQQNIDAECRTHSTMIILRRWLSVRLDLLGSLLVLGVCLFGVIFRRSVSPTKMGVVLTYVLQTTATFASLVSNWAHTEQDMNTIERVSHYGQLPLEAPPTDPRDPPADWPTQGHIIFDDVQMNYREGLPLVLKGLNFEIQPGTKVGIIGRTGAGKSSLGQVLFRMVELAKGRICIDGVDIKSMGLDTLRRQLSIIPQDPLLYSGTIRENLDPEGVHTEHDLQQALQRCGLVPEEDDYNKQRFEKFQLDEVVGEGGVSFSSGEQQLVALARALVKNRKVIILDEATSSVDIETDSIIQRTIQTEFSDVTLISIAHRLATVAFYDKVLVMDGGCVAEYDTPLALYDDHSSIFYGMCEAAGLSRFGIECIRAGNLSGAATRRRLG